MQLREEISWFGFLLFRTIRAFNIWGIDCGMSMSCELP
jgi:hypothetical protein